MPRILPQRKRKTQRSRAVIELHEIQQIRRAVADPLEGALFEWIYTNGTRASEPGLARMADVDLKRMRIQLVHLKGGLDPDWIPMPKICAQAIEKWLPVRDMLELRVEQQDFLFPAKNPGRCYPCKGTAKIIKKNRKEKTSSMVPCYHCDACGIRWGLSRHEVRYIFADLFARAGIEKERRFPHILRASAVTHMLDQGYEAGNVQERVGHASSKTTFGYMKATKAAHATIDKIFNPTEE